MTTKQENLSIRYIMNKFNTPEKCIEYLESIRWKDGVFCSKCDCKDVKRHPTQAHQWYCRGCQKNFNVKMGTIFFRAKVPLQDWFLVIAQMLLVKKGRRCIKSNINGCRHKVSKKYLQTYVDEQVFRFNHKSEPSLIVFHRVLALGLG